MNRKLLRSALILVILASALPACTRSYTKPPVVTPTTSETLSFGVGAQPTVIVDIKNWTATAEAGKSLPQDAVVSTATPSESSGGIGAGEEATATPEVAATNTPAPAATATPTVVVPTSTPGRPHTYTIVYGEWPICVARRFNLDLDSFFFANHLNMQSRILAGTVLVIPQGGTWSSVYGPRYWHTHPATYTVRPGDNINSIACYYGDIDPSTILAANGLSGAYTLHVGQNLQIP